MLKARPSAGWWSVPDSRRESYTGYREDASCALPWPPTTVVSLSSNISSDGYRPPATTVVTAAVMRMIRFMMLSLPAP